MSQQYSRWQDLQRQPGATRSSRVEEVRLRIHQEVIEKLGTKLTDDEVDQDELQRLVQEQVHKALAETNVALSATERTQLIRDVMDDALGYGPIHGFLQDPGITEVMVNGPKVVYIERRGKIERTDVEFVDEDHLRRTIDKIVSEVGRRIDEASPMVDARLPDGSRVNAVIHPIAIGGPFLTIRRFSKEPYTAEDLINFGSLTPQVAHFLDACVRGQLNTIISGGTGTGKTTLLNVLSSFIPDLDRIVTIEDAKELRLSQEHVCSLEARPPNVEGVGEVKIRELVRNSLRMRPDRVIVGEARGAEALDMLQAMNTGHDGSLTTVHANSARDALARIETMTLMGGIELPVRAIREQMASALDMIVHISRLRDGSRRVTSVSEVLGMEGDTIVLQDVYAFDFGMGVDEQGRFLGRLKSTGIRPNFSERLADAGVKLEPELFTLEPFARRVVGLR
jgi:pilus assembly protein CpaF